MQKTINALKVRQNLGQVLEEVFYNHAQVIVERAGRPMAAVIPLSDYESWKRQREEDFKVFDRIRAKNKGIKLEEVGRDIHEAIRAVRKERHA